VEWLAWKTVQSFPGRSPQAVSPALVRRRICEAAFKAASCKFAFVQNLTGATHLHLQFQVGVYEQRKSFELRPDQGLLFRRYKSYHPDEILAAVLVQQLPVPLVHLQVLVEVLEDDHAVAALVQVGQHREALPGHFHFIPERPAIAGLPRKRCGRGRTGAVSIDAQKSLWFGRGPRHRSLLDPGVDEQLGDVPAQLRVHRFDENENFGVASQSRFGFVVVVLRYSGAVHDAASYVRLGAVASLYETGNVAIESLSSVGRKTASLRESEQFRGRGSRRLCSLNPGARS
jgi:hypothetical protein